MRAHIRREEATSLEMLARFHAAVVYHIQSLLFFGMSNYYWINLVDKWLEKTVCTRNFQHDPKG
jgi:hypothetical protein